MSACRRMRILAWKICAAALLCVPAGAAAQLVYKQFDAAGHITYGDRPDPAASTATTPTLDVAHALARSTAMSSRGAAIIDANEAVRRLRQAEHAQCPERIPDEQARSADALAAKDRYANCQARLRRAIEQAQLRVDKTNRLLRASR